MSHVHDPQVYKSSLYHCSTTRDDRLGIYNRCNHLARFKAYTSTCHAFQSSEHVRVYFIIILVFDSSRYSMYQVPREPANRSSLLPMRWPYLTYMER